MPITPAGRSLRLAASVALAVPAVALSTLFGAAVASAETGTMPAPSPSQSPATEAHSNPGTPSTGTPRKGGPKKDNPKKDTPAATHIDAKIRLQAPHSFNPGQRNTITLTVKGSEPTEFLGRVALPQGLRIAHIESPGWIIGPKAETGRFTFASNPDAPNADAKPITIEVVATEGPKRKGDITAHVEVPDAGNEDPYLDDNDATKSVVIQGANTVSGRVWHDRNRNGIQDAGEPGVAHAVVLVGKLDADDATAAVQTKADGRYEFKALLADKYAVVVATPDKTWNFTATNAGTDDGVDSDVRVGFLPNDGSAKLRRDAHKSLTRKVATAGEPQFNLAGVYPVVVDGSSPLDLDAGLVHDAATSPSPAPSPTTPPAPGGSGSLPITGAGLTGLIGAGAVLLGGGAGLVLVARRRRATTTLGT